MAIRRTTRRRLVRMALYALFAVLVAVAALTADWESLANNFLRLDIARDQFPQIITIALRNTLLFTVIAFAGGLLLGILLALMKLSSIGPYRWFATAYIELFRGLPALLTIFAISFMLPIAFGVRVPFAPAGGALVGLIAVAGAYMAEVIRAGIQAVPKGQTEASRSLGMSPGKTMVFVTLPQGFRIIIPPMTNEFVLLLKDTSLVFIAGTTPLLKELTTYARDQSSALGNSTVLLMAALLYLVVTVPLTRVAAYLERRLARSR
ncbi:amino acid ABC transporter permease [Pseudactinotalea sp.]|uniref:amino acid ABC transporter permease n=1 Tax=Pseudactinotalea sp. TaxID=1926260 RepID=UPI003B3BA52D